MGADEDAMILVLLDSVSHFDHKLEHTMFYWMYDILQGFLGFYLVS